MFREVLETAGLTHDEAEIYNLLLVNGASGAGKLLAKTDMKRGLLYKTIERLAKRGLVDEKTVRGRAVFHPAQPEELLKAAEIKELEAARIKKAVETALPEMKAKFSLASERPVIRFYEGAEGLRKLYEDKLLPGSAKEFRFIRPREANVYQKAFGKWFGYYLARRSEMDIKTFAITPDDPDANHDPKKDVARKVTRTWIRPEDYSSHVEINTHGEQVEIVSYGKEIFAIAINDAYIAKAINDLLVLADRGAKTITVKHDHK